MQGTIVMMLALSGLGCHHKSCAPVNVSACYSACYSSCYGGGGCIGSRQSGRRHFPGADFADYFFEDGGICAGMGPAEAFEHDAAGFGLLAMATGTVTIREGSWRGSSAG